MPARLTPFALLLMLTVSCRDRGPSVAAAPGDGAPREVEVARVQQGQGVLIMTDMFDGTPSNLAMTFLGQDNVEVITGVNLPMLIKLARPAHETELLSLAREMREDGRNAIWVASDLLRGDKG